MTGLSARRARLAAALRWRPEWPLAVVVVLAWVVLAVIPGMHGEVSGIAEAADGGRPTSVLRHVQTDGTCRRLMTVPGVGAVTAAAFLATVDDRTEAVESHVTHGRQRDELLARRPPDFEQCLDHLNQGGLLAISWRTRASNVSAATFPSTKPKVLSAPLDVHGHQLMCMAINLRRADRLLAG